MFILLTKQVDTTWKILWGKMVGTKMTTDCVVIRSCKSELVKTLSHFSTGAQPDFWVRACCGPHSGGVC